MTAQFIRLAELGRARLSMTVDGRTIEALEGDTVLTAILTSSARLRENEFDGAPRAGFCLMGACQDCWIWTDAGEQLRACSTPARNDMTLCTTEPAWTSATSS